MSDLSITLPLRGKSNLRSKTFDEIWADALMYGLPTMGVVSHSGRFCCYAYITRTLGKSEVKTEFCKHEYSPTAALLLAMD